VLAIDTRLAAGHWKRAETRDVQKTYNLMTKAEVAELCPSFDWDGYITALGGSDRTLAEACVRQPSYFEHLSGVLLTQLTRTDMLHVPYKGVPQAIADAMANEVQLTYAVVPAAMPHVQSGRLRALGVTTPTRAPLLPDVPSISEMVPGYAMYGWYSIVAPTGTPAAVLNQASSEMVRVMKEPAFGERLKALGVDLVAGDRQTLDKWRAEELQRIRAVVKMAGAKQ
jgi:tripartite-type tricarboxylate transporter receptor subunit TctC